MKFYKDPKLTIALFEASYSLMNDFCSCVENLLFLEPSKKNNYIWALADLTGYSDDDINGAIQQLEAIEKGYIK